MNFEMTVKRFIIFITYIDYRVGPYNMQFKKGYNGKAINS